jgi:hypothetical protein
MPRKKQKRLARDNDLDPLFLAKIRCRLCHQCSLRHSSDQRSPEFPIHHPTKMCHSISLGFHKQMTFLPRHKNIPMLVRTDATPNKRMPITVEYEVHSQSILNSSTMRGRNRYCLISPRSGMVATPPKSVHTFSCRL